MTEVTRPLKVFLCHASADKPKVRELCNRLKDDNVDVWLDEKKLLPGQDWDLEIRKAIRVADVILVVLSKYSVTKEGYVQKEIKRALDIADEKLESTIFIIPARLDDCEVPDRLQRWRWVNLFSQNSYEILIKALTVRAEQIGVLLPGQQDGQPRKRSVLPSIKKEYLVAFIGAITIIFAAITSIMPWGNWLGAYLAATKTALTTPPITATPTLTLTPFATKESTFTPPTAESTPTSTSQYVEFIDAKGVKMRLVPAGVFMMGGNADDAMLICEKYWVDCQRNWYKDEGPPHRVNIPDFYMDIYEVTNGYYEACVEAGACIPPKEKKSYMRDDYYHLSRFADYPVIYVDWNQARTYCEWRGARLPTEAEWEKAARGTFDERTYPWGDGILDTFANYNYNVSDTTKVGYYEKGKSPFGIYDMAGNVMEWVADWYDANYYATLGENAFNPHGPQSGQERVLRGGSWNDIAVDLRVSSRVRKNPGYAYSLNFIGFRCARSP